MLACTICRSVWLLGNGTRFCGAGLAGVAVVAGGGYGGRPMVAVAHVPTQCSPLVRVCPEGEGDSSATTNSAAAAQDVIRCLIRALYLLWARVARRRGGAFRVECGSMRMRVRILLFLLLAAPLAAASLPAPEAVFGFRPGADYKLATYNQSVDYFKRIAASSRLVRLLEAGPTT